MLGRYIGPGTGPARQEPQRFAPVGERPQRESNAWPGVLAPVALGQASAPQRSAHLDLRPTIMGTERLKPIERNKPIVRRSTVMTQTRI